MIQAEKPVQSWKTDGIAPMERPGAVARLFMAIVAFVERLNLKLAKLGNPCIYDRADFPWAAGVEREWRAIRAELDHVLVRKADLPNVQEITADAAALSRDAGWKIFPLVAYGLRSQPNIDLCPQTWRIVQAIPGLTTVMFSILEPGKRIPPHRGPYNGVLRLHLGLIVPQPRERLAIRVGRAAPLAGRRGPDLRRRLRARGLERDRRAPRGAVRRFREAAALPCQCPEPTAAPSGRLHAFRPGRRRQPAALGATLPRPTDAGFTDVTGRRCQLPGSPGSATPISGR